MTDEIRKAADDLADSVERIITERDLAQTKLKIAVLGLQMYARLDGDSEFIGKNAREILTQLGEVW